MKTLFLLLILSSCATLISGKPKEGKASYAYTDVSGTYRFEREHKLIAKKLVSRTQLFQSGGTTKILEKSINVSHLGSVKQGKGRVMVLRPEASDFVVWLEGKKYSSSMRLNAKTKSLQVRLDSPEPKWKGLQEFPFPRTKDFCFYAQVPDCLYHNSLLLRAMEKRNEKFEFTLIWDSWPYLQEQLSNVGTEVFSPATLTFEGEKRGILHFSVEADGQLILYHFSKSFDLVRIVWIAQGITVSPPGEAPQSDIE